MQVHRLIWVSDFLLFPPLMVRGGEEGLPEATWAITIYDGKLDVHSSPLGGGEGELLKSYEILAK